MMGRTDTTRKAVSAEQWAFSVQHIATQSSYASCLTVWTSNSCQHLLNTTHIPSQGRYTLAKKVLGRVHSHGRLA